MSLVAAPNRSLSHCSHPEVMNCSAAIERLRTLVPGSEEYLQLQKALISKIGITEIVLKDSSYKIDPFSKEERLIGGFGSSEHVAIGKAMNLKGLAEETPILEIGLNALKFHHIVALAGDFYGIAGEPISLFGVNDADKEVRFIAAFNTLAEANPIQLGKILAEIGQECEAVEHAGLPHHCYSEQMMIRHQALNKIKGDINDLLADNSDHFSIHAEHAYRVGHALAIDHARAAGLRGDIEGLKRAYALDAFACHFLTDLFASGHIRNQRGELEMVLMVLPSGLGVEAEWVKKLAALGLGVKKLAGLLTGAQHEKDGHEGLNVCNGKGEHWRAYGDGHFFLPKNEENKAKVIEATQSSVDEVYAAYSNPNDVFSSTMQQFIPHATSFNPPPLYAVEDGALFIYQEVDRIPIESTIQYVDKGMGQAFQYLPQNYINGFVDGEINRLGLQLHPILTRAIKPQIDRLTGTLWEILGIASAQQVRRQDARVNQKIDEMADTIQTTYQATSRILAQLTAFGEQLAHLQWAHTFGELKGAIEDIKDQSYAYRRFNSLSQDQKNQARDRLWHAQIRLGRVLEEGVTANGIFLLPAYGNMLKETSQLEASEMGDDEIRARVTLWFKQLIDYQTRAFGLYGILCLELDSSDHATDLLRGQTLDFRSAVLEQIHANRDWVDIELLNQSSSYIQLQIEKTRFKKIWALQLNP